MAPLVGVEGAARWLQHLRGLTPLLGEVAGTQDAQLHLAGPGVPNDLPQMAEHVKATPRLF